MKLRNLLLTDFDPVGPINEYLNSGHSPFLR